MVIANRKETLLFEIEMSGICVQWIMKRLHQPLAIDLVTAFQLREVMLIRSEQPRKYGSWCSGGAAVESVADGCIDARKSVFLRFLEGGEKSSEQIRSVSAIGIEAHRNLVIGVWLAGKYGFDDGRPEIIHCVIGANAI